MQVLLLAAVLTAGNVEVVVEKHAPPTVLFAGEELTNLLSRTFGSAVPQSATPTAGKTSIVLGDTPWSRQAGIDVTGLARDAFVIRAEGDRIYIVGRDDPKTNLKRMLDYGGWGAVLFERATLFGVYEFLERFAGARFYFPGELGTILPRKGRIEVSGEVFVKPDFQSRFLQMWHGEYFEPDPRNRKKTLDYMRLRFETFRPPACHGSNGFMYQRRFAKTHPEYFCLLPNGKRDLCEERIYQSVQPGQLCWSSGVTEEMYRDALSYLRGEPAEVRGIPLRRGKNGQIGWNGNCKNGLYVDLMPQDGMIPCGCEKCTRSRASAKSRGLGEATDLVWGTVSNVATRLTAAGVDGIVSMMAYGSYATVPDFALPSNIVVMASSSGPWSLYNEKKMAADDWKISSWARKLGKPIRLWNYVCKNDKRNYGIPQTCPRTWARYYQHVAKWINGAFAESESDRWFYNYLNYYVFSKVCWKNDVDVNALLDEHHRLMFGPAAAEMSEIYDQLEECWVHGIVGNIVETPMGPVVRKPSLAQTWEGVYSPARLARLEELFRQALGKVSPDSLEMRRIRLVESEFMGGLRRRSAEYWKIAEEMKALRIELAVGESKTLSLKPLIIGHRDPNREKVGTDVMVRRTADSLVVTYVCEEPDVDQMAASAHEPDNPRLYQENVVELIVDPDGDRSSVAHFFVNSEGSVADSLESCISMPTDGFRWNSGFTAKVEKHASSWTAELTVPLKAFPKLPKTFAVEFGRERNLTRKSAIVHVYHWSPQAYGFNDVENFGELELKD